MVYDYLVTTNKPTGGKEYQRLEATLERLRGTSIKTDIMTGGTRVKEGFGLIDSWTIVEKSPDNERMIAVEVTLSKWLFNAVQAREVLTIHRNYFRLRKPLERRLYELARKHCGNQASWGCKPEPPEFPSWVGNLHWCGVTPNSCFPAATPSSRKRPA